MSQDSTEKKEGANGGEATIAMAASSDDKSPASSTAMIDNNQQETNILLNRRKAIRVLEHRKMLLERMQLCQRAAAERLSLYGEQGEFSPAVAESNGINEEDAISSRKRKFPSKDIEVKTYADLSKHAMDFTVKKVPVVKAAPPTSTRNISLRTGSSVGNKMKAAVATLTSNVGWISDTSSSSGIQTSTVPSNSSVTPLGGETSTIAKNSSSDVNIVNELKDIQQNVSDSSGIQIPKTEINPDITISVAAAPAPMAHAGKKLNSGKQLKKKSAVSGKKRSGKMMRGVANISSSELPSVSSKPLHLMANKGLNNNARDQGIMPSRVVCPEAEQLRRKRRSLILKLEKLRNGSHSDLITNGSTVNEKVVKDSKSDDIHLKVEEQIPTNSIHNFPFDPFNLPMKRKTQWDYVLEEMRWMATDFVEENKWKTAKARTLSAAINTYHTKATTKLRRIRPDQLSQSTKNCLNPPPKSIEKAIPNSEYKSEILPEELVPDFAFVDPTDNDKLFVKSVVGELNSMIKLFWECTVDNQYVHRNFNTTGQGNSSNANSLLSRGESTHHTKATQTTEIRQLLYNDIEKEVKRFHEKAATIKRSNVDGYDKLKADITSNMKGDIVGVHEKHIDQSLFIQELWNDYTEPHITGSILTGPIGCGKTFLTSLLLWQRRLKGRQLLICPGASLLRWKHELGKFSNLQLQIVGDDDSDLSMTPSLDREGCDIVICEFSVVSSYLSSQKQKQFFATVVIDIRCTSLSYMFASSPQQMKPSHSRKRRVERCLWRNHFHDESAFDELYSFEWWNQIIGDAVCSSTKCVLVETSGISDDFEFLESSKASPVHTKDRVDLIASKVAFLYHTIFQSKLKTYCRRALWWAKRHYSMSKNDSELPGGVKGLLLQILDSITCRLDLKNMNVEVTESILPQWSLQTCPLSSTQREAYDRTCLFLGGSFHNGGKKSEQLLSSAKSLLRLRRACFHSNLHEFANSVRFRNCASSYPLKYSDSCSQPNVAEAKALLTESSKLKQLLLILCKDCGFDVPEKGFLLGSKAPQKGKRASLARKKKVLILASLPEVLLLISSFLNTIGIAHDLLFPPYLTMTHSENNDPSLVIDDRHMVWAHFQNSIKQYDTKNSNGTQSESRFGPDVLISSPTLLGSSSLGIGASSAEVVISMDEDWSGRTDLSLYSILEKNRINNLLKGDRHYIKLISEGTCEQTFLSCDTKFKDTSVEPSPYSIHLFQGSTENSHDKSLQNPRPVLGYNILRFVGFPLHEVLCSRALPRTGFLGNSTNFLECFNVPLNSKDGLCMDLNNGTTTVCNLMNERINKWTSQEYHNSVDTFIRIMVSFEMSTYLPYCWSIFPATPRTNPYYNSDGPLSIASEASKSIGFDKKPIQRYVMSVKPILSKIEAARINVTNVPSKLQERVSVTNKDEKLVKSDSIFSTPEDISNSLIFYTCYRDDSEYLGDVSNFDIDGVSSNQHRKNFYIRSFMNMKRNFDGHQGSESLVYFPPLFPGLLEARQGSEKDLNQCFLRRDMGFLEDSKKRKVPLDGYPGSSKKLRTPHPSTNLPEFSSSIPSVTPSQPLPQLPGEFNFIADDDFMDAASDFFDGEFLPDLNITKDEDISSDTQISEGAEEEDTTAFVFDEDFGLLGAGILPSTHESSKAATMTYGYSNKFSYWLDPFEPLPSDDEFPFRGPGLNSVVLHVRKSNKYQSGILGRSFAGTAKGITHDSNKGIPVINGPKICSTDSLFQKKKKSVTNSTAVTAFVLPSALNSQKVKDGDYSTLPVMLQPKDTSHAMERKSNSTIKTAAIRGLPSLRVHHDLQDIFDPSNNQIIGSRILLFNNQMPLVSSDCAIRKLLPDENTGDSALLLSKKQSESFCSDSGLSHGVDFGPFTVSVLPESMLKFKTPPLATISGISLPMGVKMPKSAGSGIFTSNIEGWSPLEDEMLKFYASKFGHNWRAVSQLLALNSRYSACFDSETIVNPLRSANQCKERWRRLQTTPCSDEKENSNNQHNKFEVDSDLSLQYDEIFTKGLLLDVSMLQESEDHYGKVASEKDDVASRLRRLRKAGAHRKIVPLTIPGYTAGENAPPLQIVQSHPSHSQSVQEAIANSARPSGIVPPRAEMWPLQFLDLTEKQLQEVEKKKLASAVAQSQVSRQSIAARNLQPQPSLQHPSAQSVPSSRDPSRSGQPNAASTQMMQSVPRQTDTQSAMARSQQHPLPSTKVPPQHHRQGLPGTEQNLGNGNNTGFTR